MIGKRIRAQRKTENLSLEQVAKRTGLSIGYLSNLERDLTSPTFDNLILICTAIGVSVVELISSSLEFKPVIKSGEGELLYSRDYHC
ncbi:MAG: helix-turn-helix transcriptional regulator, partial [Bacillota bacterium]|nr:helix-turn-helix transcriptional regulator [Bacillota bacterium]